MKFFNASRQSVAEIYPIVHAARVVRDLNSKYLQQGKRATVTARFGKDGITLIDPNRAGGKTFQAIYKKPI